LCRVSGGARERDEAREGGRQDREEDTQTKRQMMMRVEEWRERRDGARSCDNNHLDDDCVLRFLQGRRTILRVIFYLGV